MPIETVEGDIADQPDPDAVVNAANAQLRIGGTFLQVRCGFDPCESNPGIRRSR